MIQAMDLSLILPGIKPLFIFSIHRSGSTLLQSLFDGHPQLLSDVADSRFFYAYYPFSRGKCFKEKAQLAEKILISHIFNLQSHYYQDFLSFISIEELKSNFYTLLNRSRKEPKDFLESYIYALGFASGALSENTRYWVDKTLRSEYSFRRIIKWWPEARIIYLFRDPRDVYASYKQRDIKNRRKITSIDEFTYTWSVSAKTYMKYLDHVGSERCFLLHYESLVSSLEDTLAKLLKFLDIEDHPILYIPTKGHGRVRWMGNPASGDKTGSITTTRTGKWRTYLSENEVQSIESMLRREMTWIGYDPTNERRTFLQLTHLVIKNKLRAIRDWARTLGL